MTLLRTVTSYIKTAKTFERVLQKVTILSVGNGECTAEFKVDESHINAVGVLHGGFSAVVVDCISSYALRSKTDDDNLATSEIHTRYLKMATVGDVVAVRGHIVKQGKGLIFLEVELKNKNSGELLVKEMGGWRLEIAKMAMYITFPVAMFHYFNQPEFFEDWVIKTKRELYPRDNTPQQIEFLNAIKEIKEEQEAERIKALEASSKQSAFI